MVIRVTKTAVPPLRKGISCALALLRRGHLAERLRAGLPRDRPWQDAWTALHTAARPGRATAAQ